VSFGKPRIIINFLLAKSQPLKIEFIISSALKFSALKICKFSFPYFFSKALFQVSKVFKI
jgi:hypothetical protein